MGAVFNSRISDFGVNACRGAVPTCGAQAQGIGISCWREEVCASAIRPRDQEGFFPGRPRS